MLLVYCQPWEETEFGWGERPDGFSLHLTEPQVKQYIQAYWDVQPKDVPKEYSRPYGDPYIVQVDEATSSNRLRGTPPQETSVAYFCEPPVQVLETKEDVLAVVNDPNWRKDHVRDWTRFKSVWLIGLIEEIMAAKKRSHAYNHEVKQLAWERLGLPPLPEAEYHKEGDALSALVYDAQCYRRHDQYVAEGYEPFDTALLQRAGEGGKIQLRKSEPLFKIVVNGQEVVDNDPPTVLTVRRVNDRLYAFKPRMRKYAAMPDGRPAKIVQGK